MKARIQTCPLRDLRPAEDSGEGDLKAEFEVLAPEQGGLRHAGQMVGRVCPSVGRMTSLQKTPAKPSPSERSRRTPLPPRNALFVRRDVAVERRKNGVSKRGTGPDH